MKKRGFTLIELLAVIVILAIIAFIAVPIIMGVIEQSKRGAFKASSHGIVKAAELAYMEQTKLGTIDEEMIYTYTNGLEFSESGIPLQYKGSKPKSGLITILQDGRVELWLSDGTYCAVKGADTEEIDVKTLEEAENCGEGLLPPVITVEGHPNNQGIIITINAGDTFTPPVVTAEDNFGMDLTSSITLTGSVDSNIPGTYILTYRVEDERGNIATKSITVQVNDTIAPTITFGTNGDNTWRKEHGSLVTVTDTSGIDNSNLKYLWSASTTAPEEIDFENVFMNNISISDNSQTKNGIYYLWVLAKDIHGNTSIEKSNGFSFDNTPPNIASMIITATDVTGEGFTITRTGNATDSNLAANPYTYSVSTDGTAWTSVKTLTNDTTASVTGLSPGVSRYYRVCAVDIALNSICSTSQSVTTLVMEPPSQPGAFASITKIQKAIGHNITWGAVSNWGSLSPNRNYRLEASYNAEDYEFIANTNAFNNYTIISKNDESFTSITFRVRAETEYGQSDWRYSQVIPLFGWQKQIVGTQNHGIMSLHGSAFVSVGSAGQIARAINGTSWQSQQVGTANYSGIYYNSGRSVAIAAGRYISTSTDGLNWTQQQITELSTSIQFTDVFYGNGTWVIVMNANRFLTSTNGTTWTENVPPFTGGRSVSYAGGHWLVGGYNVIQRSTNLSTWTTYTGTQNYYYDTLYYANGRWMALGYNGSNGHILTSTDGTNWTVARSGRFQSVYYTSAGGGRWVAVGNNGLISTSTNGTTWSTVTPLGTPTNVTFNYVYGSGNRWIAVGNNGVIAQSNNGIDWYIQQISGTGNLTSVMTYGTVWNAVGANGTVLTLSF